MFQFPGCPPRKLWIHLRVSRHYPGRVPPFGYPRIVACLQLPVAFRSLPRPSSAVGALASALCSYSLDFFVALLLRPTYNFLFIFPFPFRLSPSVSGSDVSVWFLSPFRFRFLPLPFESCHYPLQLAYSESLSLCSCQGALLTPLGACLFLRGSGSQ